MKSLAVSLLALAATVTAAAAESPRDHRIERRGSNQDRQIAEGVRAGDLTRREARELRSEQARIDDLVRRARSDGRIDRHEARRIEAAQDAASRHIATERHDSDRRGAFWQRRWW